MAQDKWIPTPGFIAEAYLIGVQAESEKQAKQARLAKDWSATFFYFGLGYLSFMAYNAVNQALGSPIPYPFALPLDAPRAVSNGFIVAGQLGASALLRRSSARLEKSSKAYADLASGFGQVLQRR